MNACVNFAAAPPPALNIHRFNFSGDVVAHWGDVVAHCWRCSGLLLEMWWLIVGDLVAHC